MGSGMMTSYNTMAREGVDPEELKERYGSDWIASQIAEIDRWAQEGAVDYSEHYERLFVAAVIDLIALGHPKPKMLADAVKRAFAIKYTRCLDDFKP